LRCVGNAIATAEVCRYSAWKVCCGCTATLDSLVPVLCLQYVLGVAWQSSTAHPLHQTYHANETRHAPYVAALSLSAV
jgi:hypothetical protein